MQILAEKILEIGSHKLGETLAWCFVNANGESQRLLMPSLIGMRTYELVVVVELLRHGGDKASRSKDVSRCATLSAADAALALPSTVDFANEEIITCLGHIS